MPRRKRLAPRPAATNPPERATNNAKRLYRVSSAATNGCRISRTAATRARSDGRQVRDDVRVITDASTFVDRFVVEVGRRQAWPFLTLCANRPEKSDEIRLYIDTAFEVAPGPAYSADGETSQLLVAIGALENLTVVAAAVGEVGDPSLTFDNDRVLRVSGVASAYTGGPPWWISRP
jgi:hypothetical protein